MQADESEGILNGANDIMSATASDKDPLFANFTRQSDININVGGNGAGAPQTWDDAWISILLLTLRHLSEEKPLLPVILQMA